MTAFVAFEDLKIGDTASTGEMAATLRADNTVADAT